MSKTSKKRNRPSAVSYPEFVKLWKGAKSVGEVAKAFGIKPNSCSAIAARLRLAGVKLHSFPKRAPQAVDTKQLNKLIAR
jgi:hypothetical protein